MSFSLMYSPSANRSCSFMDSTLRRHLLMKDSCHKHERVRWQLTFWGTIFLLNMYIIYIYIYKYTCVARNSSAPPYTVNSIKFCPYWNHWHPTCSPPNPDHHHGHPSICPQSLCGPGRNHQSVAAGVCGAVSCQHFHP